MAAMRPDRAIVKKAIADANGVLSRAAALLGCSRPTLYQWIYQLGLERHAGIRIDSQTGVYRGDRKDTRSNNSEKKTNQVLSHGSASGHILRVVPPTTETVDYPVQAGVKLPESLWRQVKIEAIREGVTVSEYVKRTLEEKLTSAGRRKRAEKGGDE